MGVHSTWPALRSRPPSKRIAGRYTVEAALASGGMGSVYRVREESTGKQLALKRLLSDAGNGAALLFRKEYHTLARLRHPRIIEVYDYGIDAEGPYYTMELLDGRDLRALAPMGYRDACRYLRDVASSLGLLHAQRLLHRDLTPANVRVTSDGRCKLIDFGALAPFGVPEALVGTPPFVPPEALRGLALDQRADLFSFGALAYYLLTKIHAFPARSLSELEGMWTRRPRPPSALLAEAEEPAQAALPAIPKALDELILSLLSVDPLARPTSAAELIERLDSIGQLEPDSEPTVAQGYFLSARLAGRTLEVERAKQLASCAVDGAGCALVIEHAPGSGATRLLTEIGLEARLAGATILHVDADVYRGPFAIAKALAQKLSSALPQRALEAATADVLALGWLAPRGSERAGPKLPPIDVSASPGIWRLRVQSALENWFLEVADAQPLAVLVDNFQRVDEGSAALLASAAPQHALMVVATMRNGESATAPAATRKLLEGAARVSLGPLAPADSSALVCSLFGDASNAERVARWLHRRSGGYPQHLMELSRYLVTHGLARYIDGAWVLPRELPSDVPSRLEDTLDDRLAQLTPEALQLARALSVHEGPLSLELCSALAESEQGDPFAALDELAAQGILMGFGSGYHFSQEALRKRILARLSEEERRRLHRLLGAQLLKVAEPDLATTLSAGWHLFHGGDEVQGADILRRVGLDLVATDELPEAIPALEAAVAVYRKLGRPRYQLLGLLAPLAFAGYYVDRRLADLYGDETLELLAHETGLTLTVRLRRYIGSYLSLLVGLLYAILLHLFGGRGGLRVLNDRIAILGGISCALTGTSTICLDHAGAARRAAVFEPFSVMGKRHGGAFCHALAKSLVGLTEDRAAHTIAELRDLLLRLDAPFGVIGLPKPLRPIIRGGILFALGALEGFCDPPRALERADALEACGLRLYDMVACQLRANYYGCQGAAASAREWEKQVEMHAVRNGSAWQAEAWAPSSKMLACIITGDLLGLKHAAEELDRLSAEIPSFACNAKLARATLQALRGEQAAALPMLEELLASCEPRAVIGWGAQVGQLASVYNDLGQHARAEALCKEALAQLDEEDRMVVTMNLRIEIQLALAEAGLGRLDAAAARLDALLAKHQVQRGAVSMGSLHRARAQVAQQAGDRAALEEHCKQTEYWFRTTENPALIAQSERMVQLMRLSSSPPVEGGAEQTVVDRFADQPSLLLAAGSGPEQRAQRAIDYAARLYRARSGWLFGVREGELAWLATHGTQPQPDGMAQALRERLALLLEEQTTMTQTATPAHEALAGYLVVPLVVDSRVTPGEPHVLGAIVMTGADAHAAAVPERFVRRFARVLYESADVSTLRPIDGAGRRS
jgi:hypothetical protein